MDLLGSIIDKMDGPPTVSDQQKKVMKKQREEFFKRQEEERSKLKHFKKEMEISINDFVQDNKLEKITLPPMNKMHRSIVHEIAEIAGLSAFSFGEEDIDRHVVIYKKEFTPSPEELTAYRKGQAWNPALVKLSNTTLEDADNLAPLFKKDSPPALYLNKYERLVGKEAVKEAARVTQVNRKYGFVSSENKKDQRSIEQTLADIRAKKRLKKD